MSLARQREFLLREKLFSLRDKVNIMDPATQAPVGYVERKLWSIRPLYRLYDLDGRIEMIVQQKLFALRPTFLCYEGNPSGRPEDSTFLGTLKRKFFSFRPRYWFESIDGGRQFEVTGNFIGLKYEITRDGRQIGSIAKTFWAIRDTYGLKLDATVPDRLALLLLASVVVIHALHERRERRARS